MHAATSTATGINFLMNAEDKLDVRVELDIHALVFTRVTEQIVTDLRLNEENRKTKKTAALTILFFTGGRKRFGILPGATTRPPMRL